MIASFVVSPVITIIHSPCNKPILAPPNANRLHKAYQILLTQCTDDTFICTVLISGWHALTMALNW